MGRTEKAQPVPQALDPPPAGTSPILRAGDSAVAYHVPIAPANDDVSPLKTTIVLPRRSEWTSGLHYHATHTEYLRLVKGAIFVELNGETKFFSTSKCGEVDQCTGKLVQNGLVIEVPRYARHNWGRLEHYIFSPPFFKMGRGVQTHNISPEDWAEEVIVQEWTDPSDIQKPLFFWNLNGIIMGSDKAILNRRQRIARRILAGWWIDLQLFVVFWELDNWPVFFDLRRGGIPFEGSRGTIHRLMNGLEVITSLVVLFIARIVGFLIDLRAVERQRTPEALWNAYHKPAHYL